MTYNVSEDTGSIKLRLYFSITKIFHYCVKSNMSVNYIVMINHEAMNSE